MPVPKKKRAMPHRWSDAVTTDFDASSGGPLQQERCRDRSVACLEESLTQGAEFSHAHADFLHQSRRSQPERDAEGRTSEGKEPVVETHCC